MSSVLPRSRAVFAACTALVLLLSACSGTPGTSDATNTETMRTSSPMTSANPTPTAADTAADVEPSAPATTPSSPTAVTPDACINLETGTGAVVSADELGACVGAVILARNTYRVVTDAGMGANTGDVRLTPFALHLATADGDVYEVRENDVWQTAGENAPLQTTLDYDGDDYQQLIVAKAALAAYGFSGMEATEQLIAGSTTWTVRGRESHANANGNQREGIAFAADAPAGLGDIQVTDQVMCLTDDFTLIAIEATTTTGGISFPSTQLFADWGSDIAFPTL